MIITYHGAQMVKISSGDFALIFNPISDKSAFKASRASADIALVSAKHPDFSGLEKIKAKNDDLFIIDGPGEYEVKGVFIKGFPSKTNYGASGSPCTIYTVKMDNINMVFFGPANLKELDMQFAEDMDSVDLVFVPVSQEEGLPEPALAHKAAVSLEAKSIVPLPHSLKSCDKILEKFLSEAGSSAQASEKLNIKKKDLETLTAAVFPLKF